MERVDITKEYTPIASVKHAWAASLRSVRPYYRTDSRVGDGFVFILGGSCEYVFDSGDRFFAEAGDLLYLASGSAYTMHVSDGEYAYICVNFAFASESARKSLCARVANVRETQTLLRRLLRLFPPGTRSAYFEQMSLVYEVYRELDLACRSDYVGKTARELILTVKEYMDLHYADPALDGRTLASLAGMSEPYFRLMFRKKFQTSPLQYVLARRLLCAEELMRYPDLTLAEIALRSGFSSLTYFCRVFKKRRGISPARYRREIDR